MDSRSNWKAFAKGDLAARNTLLTENLSLVHHVARQLERKLTNELDHDELVSAGTLGLMAAMNSFDPERGLAFSTFAVPRIRGAILDSIRGMDGVPAHKRKYLKQIQAVASGTWAPDDTIVFQTDNTPGRPLSRVSAAGGKAAEPIKTRKLKLASTT